MSAPFDRFVAIDWSGAKKTRGAIAVAVASGDAPPATIAPPSGARAWRRDEVAAWIEALARGTEGRTLVGFDFGFAYPYCDGDAYFPGDPRSPADARTLWRLVDEACASATDLYGGPFYLAPSAPFSEHLLTP